MATQSAGRSDGSFLHNLLNRAKCAISRWREVRRLDSQDIEAIAYDLNISPAELVTLMSTSSDSLEQLRERLAYAGLTEESLAIAHPDELRDLRRVCSQCASKARCARDLRHKRIAAPSKYCPNESTLRSLVRETRHEASVEASSVPAGVS
jgi:hypothetical protein